MAGYDGWSYGRLLKYIDILEHDNERDPSEARESRITAAVAERERRLSACSEIPESAKGGVFRVAADELRASRPGAAVLAERMAAHYDRQEHEKRVRRMEKERQGYGMGMSR